MSACEGGGGSCDASQMDRVDAILMLSSDAAAAQTSFASSCGVSSCHGSNGDSGPAPDLSSETADLDDTDLLCLALNGTGGMPPQDGLSDQQLADVLEYIRTSL